MCLKQTFNFFINSNARGARRMDGSNIQLFRQKIQYNTQICEKVTEKVFLTRVPEDRERKKRKYEEVIKVPNGNGEIAHGPFQK